MKTSWWTSREWLNYERAYGDEPGTRARLLASADWQTRVIDLTLSEAELWCGVRKSYRSLIRTAERRYQIFLVEAPLAEQWGMIIQDLHRQAAGRETRPATTWQIMMRWLSTGHGTAVVAVEPGDVVIDFAYFIRDAEWSYYASAASLERNVHHSVIWTGMLTLKRLGVRWLEMGWMERPGDSKKERTIIIFKRGFGGVDVPVRETLNGRHYVV